MTLNDSAVVLNDESLFYYFAHGYRYQRIKVGEVGVYGKIKTPTSGETGVELILCPTGTQTGKFANTPCIYFYDDDAPFVQEGERVIYVCTLENIVLKTNAAEEYIVADDTVEITDIVDGTSPDATYDIIFPTTKYICTQSQTASTAPFWTYLFTVENITLTDAQFESINSTATLDKINMIQTNANAITGIKNGTNINDFAAVESALSQTSNSIYLVRDTNSTYQSSLMTKQGMSGTSYRNTVLSENSTIISSQDTSMTSGEYSMTLSCKSGENGGTQCISASSKQYNIYPTSSHSVIMASETVFMSGSSGTFSSFNAIIASTHVGVGRYGTQTSDTGVGSHNVFLGIYGSGGTELKGKCGLCAGSYITSPNVVKTSASSSSIISTHSTSPITINSSASTVMASYGGPFTIGNTVSSGESSEYGNGVICTYGSGSVSVSGGYSGLLFSYGSGAYVSGQASSYISSYASGTNIYGNYSSMLSTYCPGSTINGNSNSVMASSGGNVSLNGDANSVIASYTGGTYMYGNYNAQIAVSGGNSIGTSSESANFNAYIAVYSGSTYINKGYGNIVGASDGGNSIYGSGNVIIASGGGETIGDSTNDTQASKCMLFASSGGANILSGQYNAVGASGGSSINNGTYNVLLGCSGATINNGTYNTSFSCMGSSVVGGQQNIMLGCSGGSVVGGNQNSIISSNGSSTTSDAGNYNSIISSSGSSISSGISYSSVISGTGIVAHKSNSVYMNNIDVNGMFAMRKTGSRVVIASEISRTLSVSGNYATTTIGGISPGGLSGYADYAKKNNTLVLSIGGTLYSGTIDMIGANPYSWYIGNLHLYQSSFEDSGEDFFIGTTGGQAPIQIIVDSSLAGEYDAGEIEFWFYEVVDGSPILVGNNNYAYIGVKNNSSHTDYSPGIEIRTPQDGSVDGSIKITSGSSSGASYVDIDGTTIELSALGGVTISAATNVTSISVANAASVTNSLTVGGPINGMKKAISTTSCTPDTYFCPTTSPTAQNFIFDDTGCTSQYNYTFSGYFTNGSLTDMPDTTVEGYYIDWRGDIGLESGAEYMFCATKSKSNGDYVGIVTKISSN